MKKLFIILAIVIPATAFAYTKNADGSITLSVEEVANLQKNLDAAASLMQDQQNQLIEQDAIIKALGEEVIKLRSRKCV